MLVFVWDSTITVDSFWFFSVLIVQAILGLFNYVLGKFSYTKRFLLTSLFSEDTWICKKKMIPLSDFSKTLRFLYKTCHNSGTIFDSGIQLKPITAHN